MTPLAMPTTSAGSLETANGDRPNGSPRPMPDLPEGNYATEQASKAQMKPGEDFDSVAPGPYNAAG